MRIGGKSAADVFLDPSLAALATAACNGKSNEVRRLIGNGVDVNGMGYKGMTPLLWAMACHNAAGMKVLLEQGADPNRVFDEAGDTPVIMAASGDSVESLKVLLAHGGNPNASNETDNALSASLTEGQFENYYALLAAGADVNKADEGGRTAANAAVALGYFDKVLEMLNHGYTFDLPRLYKITLIRIVDTQHFQYQNKKKVIAYLDAHGIKPSEVPSNAQR